jgi:hypothetical protein
LIGVAFLRFGMDSPEECLRSATACAMSAGSRPALRPTESARRHAFGLRRLSSSNVAMLSARGTPMRVGENKWRDEIRGHYAIGKTAAIPCVG